MEGIVAKRCLKRSYYDKDKKNLSNASNSSNNINKIYNKKKEITKKYSFIQKVKEKVIFKTILQAITMLGVVVFIVSIKVFNIEVVKNSQMATKLKIEFNKSYSRIQAVEELKNISKKTHLFLNPIIPTKVEEGVKKMFNSIRKNNGGVNIYGETNINKNNEEQKTTETNNNQSKEISLEEDVQKNIGGSVEEEVANISVSSSINSQSSTIEKIKKLGIKFVKPTKGVITSSFGAREKIFEGIDGYHTGTDIAAAAGTSIVSSIEGTVKSAKNNKYNGYYVEVEKGDVLTRYCHLRKITVEEGSKVNAGQKIGEMGSTGLSTGPHLHFEIIYSGEKVDPQKIIEL